MIINEKSSGINIPDHRGTWYVIDATKSKGRALFLLEHEEYGDEAACLIVTESGNVIVEEVWNGFSDLEDPEEYDNKGCPHCGDGGCLVCQPKWYL